MSIQEISRSASGPAIVKRCDVCGALSTIDASALSLGTSEPNHIDLPACKCGAVETLIRTTDASVDPRLSDHRRTVNALANFLQSEGKVADASASYYADPKTPAAAPVGPLFGAVSPTRAPGPPPASAAGNPVALAKEALAAALKALAAAEAASESAAAAAKK